MSITDQYKFYQKLNWNCPDSEKTGTGPGSCSGGTSDNTDEDEDQTISLDKQMKNRWKELTGNVKPSKVKKDGILPEKNIDIARKEGNATAQIQSPMTVLKFVENMSKDEQDKFISAAVSGNYPEWFDNPKIQLTPEHVKQLEGEFESSLRSGIKEKFVETWVSKWKSTNPEKFEKYHKDYIELYPWYK